MRLLLDTHAFLWYILDDPQLSAKADSLISDPNNVIEVSPASYWEIAIKVRLRKYSLPEPYEVFIEREIATNSFRILHIEPKHAAPVTTMAFHHRDPFDRLIVAQALVEQIAVVSNDAILDAYSQGCGDAWPSAAKNVSERPMRRSGSNWRALPIPIVWNGCSERL